jgi:hypothetical protein
LHRYPCPVAESRIPRRWNYGFRVRSYRRREAEFRRKATPTLRLRYAGADTNENRPPWANTRNQKPNTRKTTIGAELSFVFPGKCGVSSFRFVPMVQGSGEQSYSEMMSAIKQSRRKINDLGSGSLNIYAPRGLVIVDLQIIGISWRFDLGFLAVTAPRINRRTISSTASARRLRGCLFCRRAPNYDG